MKLEFHKPARAAGNVQAAFGAAFFVARAFLGLSAGQAAAERVACTGPLAHCVTAVGGFCDRGTDGKVTMWFAERSGYTATMEDCVGKAFEKHGRPNPYKPSSAQKSAPQR